MFLSISDFLALVICLDLGTFQFMLRCLQITIILFERFSEWYGTTIVFVMHGII